MATLATVIQPTQTPILLADVVGRLASGYVNLYSKMPPKDLLAFAAAMIGVENNGGANIWAGNVGNITSPDGVSPTGRVWAANGLLFIAYDTIAEGIEAWWQLMFRKYAQVLVDGAMGQPETAVRDLFRLGYLGSVTTPEQEKNYVAGVRRYLKQTEPFARKVTNYTARPYVGAAVAGGSAFTLVLLTYLSSRGGLL
ncbi:MAG: hypothetical protein ACRENK_16505 [Gemmatimonadaceae bacterium]